MFFMDFPGPWNLEKKFQSADEVKLGEMLDPSPIYVTDLLIY